MRLKWAAVVLLLLTAGCARGETATAWLTVNAHDYTVFEETEVSFESGDSVLDILQAAMRGAEIPMAFTGSGATAYVQGIDNLFEFDHGPDSGWLYTVNEVEVQKSAGACKPAEGDNIVWRYITER